jgi:hypothetical protein
MQFLQEKSLPNVADGSGKPPKPLAPDRFRADRSGIRGDATSPRPPVSSPSESESASFSVARRPLARALSCADADDHDAAFPATAFADKAGRETLIFCFTSKNSNTLDVKRYDGPAKPTRFRRSVRRWEPATFPAG